MAAKKTTTAKATPKALATPPAPKAEPAPARVPPTAARPTNVDEPTVDLQEARTTLPTAEPPLSCRFAPLAHDRDNQTARAALKLVPGRDLRVSYDRSAADVGATGNVARIEMGYRFDDGATAMSVVADGQRNVQGVLVRRSPVVRVPLDARREMQLWFKLEMDDGSVFWDSAFSRNYRLAVLPQW